MRDETINQWIIKISLTGILTLAPAAPLWAQVSSPDKSKAISLYQRGQYREAIPLLQLIIKKNPNDDAMRVKYAYSLMKIGQYEESRSQFEYIIQHSHTQKYVDYANQALNQLPAPQISETTTAIPSQGKAIQEVRQLIQDMEKVEKLSEVAPFLSNESAAAMGLVMLIPISFMLGFAPKEKSQEIENKLQQALKPYNLDLKTTQQPGEEKLKGLTQQGRQFLKDVGLFLEAMESEGGTISKQGNSLTQQAQLKDLTFKQLSPLRVEITNTKDNSKIYAIIEENHWRLHFGGFEELMKKGMKQPG